MSVKSVQPNKTRIMLPSTSNVRDVPTSCRLWTKQRWESWSSLSFPPVLPLSLLLPLSSLSLSSSLPSDMYVVKCGPILLRHRWMTAIEYLRRFYSTQGSRWIWISHSDYYYYYYYYYGCVSDFLFTSMYVPCLLLLALKCFFIVNVLLTDLFLIKLVILLIFFCNLNFSMGTLYHLDGPCHKQSPQDVYGKMYCSPLRWSVVNQGLCLSITSVAPPVNIKFGLAN